MRGSGPKLASLMRVLLVVVPMVVVLRFSYVRGFSVSSADVVGGQLVVSGSMKVYFSDRAWSEFGYRDGNFEWFSRWWQDEGVGSTFGPVRVVSVTWTLLEHTVTYDRLGFVAVLEKR